MYTILRMTFYPILLFVRLRVQPRSSHYTENYTVSSDLPRKPTAPPQLYVRPRAHQIVVKLAKFIHERFDDE
jgi:hypothetical protein